MAGGTMTGGVEAEGSRYDVFKLGIALTLVIAALGAFYYFNEHSLLLRTMGLLAVAGVVAALAFQTERGREMWGFFKEAQIEVRKVVWPTRQESFRVTLFVLGMVLVVASILWLLDALLGWLVQWLTGHGG